MILIDPEDALHSLASAQYLYNIGFRKARNASPKYNSFGEDIRILSLNLDVLCSIIRQVQFQHETSQTPGQILNRTGGEPQLEPILGDLRTTLADCDRLLDDQRYFHKDDGCVTEVYWYYQIDPEVEKLRERINTHDAKLVLCLKTLDPHILENNLLQIIDPFVVIHTNIEQLSRQVRGYEDRIDNFQQSSEPIVIPRQLQDNFTVITREIYPNLSSIPLVRGIDAALYCFVNLSSTLDTLVHRQICFLVPIVNFMKAFWVLQTLQTTLEYHIAVTNQPTNPFERHMTLCGLTHRRFFERLEEEIYHVLKLLVGKDLLLPPTPDLLEILEKDKQIWPQDVPFNIGKKATSLHYEHTELGTKILTAHLRSPEPGCIQSTQVYNQTEKRFNMVIIKVNVAEGRERETVDTYDLEKVQLIPSYAVKTWTSPTLHPQTLLFRTDSTSPVNRVLPFQQPKDMLEFQQSITGYKVVHDESRVLATSQESKVLGGSRRQDLCRLQLWTATSRKTALPITKPSNSPHLSIPAMNSHRSSITSLTANSNSNLQIRRKTTPSIFSTSSGPSSRGSVMMESSLPGNDSKRGIYTAPTLPCVILFSHKVPEPRTDVTLRSFLIIDINPEVLIEENLSENADFRTPSFQCVIERRKGFLPARRSPETSDPNLWDLAVAGLHKRETGTQEIKKLKHVIIQFDGQTNLVQFMSKFNQAKDLAKLRLSKFMQATG